jgi:N-acetylmuramoyl-L-alanine amidase
MAKKVFLGVGHGGNDPGAVGYIKEADVNLAMAKACRDVLEDHGVKVLMSRTKDENDDLNEEIRECNAFKPDLAVDVHNNAGGGDGFECYYHVGGGTSKTLAANIEAEVKKIGQNSRGIKTKAGAGGADYYGFIRETKCPAVICEGVFVDNKKDAAQADTAAEQKAFGVAYAKGILKTLGIAYKAPAAAKKPAAAASSGKIYKVQVGAYKDKKNAEAQLAKVKKAGFDAVIVTA